MRVSERTCNRQEEEERATAPDLFLTHTHTCGNRMTAVGGSQALDWQVRATAPGDTLTAHKASLLPAPSTATLTNHTIHPLSLAVAGWLPRVQASWACNGGCILYINIAYRGLVLGQQIHWSNLV